MPSQKNWDFVWCFWNILPVWDVGRKTHAIVHNGTASFKTAGLSRRDEENILLRDVNFSNTNETTSLCCHHLNTSLRLPRKSFSTHQRSHLTLMAPSTALSDSTWNNIEALVTVKGFNPECFATDSRGTWADIPGILKWIAPFFWTHSQRTEATL